MPSSSAKPPSRRPLGPLWLAVLAVGIAAAVLAAAWLAQRETSGNAPVAMPAATAPAPSATPAATPEPATPGPSATPTATAATVAQARTSSFPQLHVNPRRVRKPAEPEKKKPRLPPHTLYQTEPDALVDTADPAEVPFEGDFPQRGTFSFWLNPVWDGTNQEDASFVTVADGRLRIVKNVSFLRFETVDANGGNDGVGFRLADWQPGEWHFITATWDEGVIALYVDGVLAGQKYIPSLELPADSSVMLGSLFPPGRPIAPGMMSGFRFRSRPLPSGLIGNEFERTMPPPIGEDAE